MVVTLVSLMSFISVAALMAGVVPLVTENRKARLESRLHELTSGKRKKVAKNSVIKRGDLNGAKLLALFRKTLGRRVDEFLALFDQPESSITFNVFLAMTGATALTGLGLAAAFHLSRAGFIGLILASGVLPLIWLIMRRQRRLKTFGKQLPDALDLLARAMRSGNSLPAGMRCIADDMLPPVSIEFAMVCERLNLGVSLEQGFADMLRRVPNRDLKFFVTALRMHRQMGGNLTEVLDNISHIVRERFKIMGQVKALTGEGRISGLVLMSLPLVVAATMYYLNPDYVLLLVKHPLGQKMLQLSIILQVFGAILIRKIVNIKI